MLDIIILIIVIKIILQTVKKHNEGMAGTRKASAQPNQPRKQAEEWKKKKSKAEQPSFEEQKPTAKKQWKPDIMDRVDQQIYGTDANKADLERYKRYLEQERRTDISKIAREMNCTMYQVIREIRDFQDMGYFCNAEIDDDNYVIRYTDQPVKQRAVSRKEHVSVQTQENEPVLSVPQAAVKKMDQEEPMKAREMQSISYMTMPAQGVDIPYMTMTGESTVSYMTMPEQGMDIYYNTIPEMKERA